MHLSWQEAYECGEPTIDAEHRELFTLANLLLDAALQGSARPAAFRDAFATLIEQVERHFADEEAILARHHYAALEPHKRARAGLLRRAHRLMAQAGRAASRSALWSSSWPRTWSRATCSRSIAPSSRCSSGPERHVRHHPGRDAGALPGGQRAVAGPGW